MQKILIIHAHPEPKSFCSALALETKKHFEEKNADVKLVDLYTMNFNPVNHKQDFTELSNPNYFKYQAEQTHAFQNDLFSVELKEQLALLEWCDTLIFSFPLWWFGLPAILKGWVDRVFAMGAVYGAGKGVYDNGYFKGKKSMLIFTTGGPEVAYGETGKNGELDTILFPIQHGMLYFCGFTVLEPFVSFSPVRKTDEEREAELKRLNESLMTIQNRKFIYH